jgi:hypothetical protein
MSRKVFSTFFSLILLIVIAVPGLNAWPRVFLRISSRFCGVLTQMRSAFLTGVPTRYWEGAPDIHPKQTLLLEFRPEHNKWRALAVRDVSSASSFSGCVSASGLGLIGSSLGVIGVTGSSLGFIGSTAVGTPC